MALISSSVKFIKSSSSASCMQRWLNGQLLQLQRNVATSKTHWTTSQRRLLNIAVQNID